MKFKTILADPPWNFDDKLDKTRRLPYNVINFEDLKRLPVRTISDEECHLYLWCPATLLPEGIILMRSWGFLYKTIIPWLKRTKNGKIWFGMGHYFRNCYEFLLFGVRGKEKTRTRSTRNHIDEKKPDRHHSAKPDKAYKIIELNSHPPYLELFATIHRKGWTSWGWELQKHDIRLNFRCDICAEFLKSNR